MPKQPEWANLVFARMSMELVDNEKECVEIENMGFGGESVKIKPEGVSIKIMM